MSTATTQRATDQGSAVAVMTPESFWRSAKAPLLVGVVVVVAAVVIAIIDQAPAAGRLDPDAAGPAGSRAVAQLLRDRGVDVRRTRTLPASSETGTILVTDALLLDEEQVDRLAAGGAGRHVVLVEPGELTALGQRVTVEDGQPVRSRQPACDLDAAETAGSAHLGGATYSVDGAATGCYAAAGRPTLVQVRRDGDAVTVLGAGDFLTNDRLDDDGNAALALGLLSEHPVVHWVLPGLFGTPGAEGDESVGSLLPARISWLALQLFVALVVTALWRGRRLGPVVTERLPVVVRAAEAVEGRARLYAAGRARGRAAELLRAGTRDRLVRALALAPDATPDAVIEAVGARTRRDGTAVAGLLYGPAPDDDESLVRLATELDTLDSEVRHT